MDYKHYLFVYFVGNRPEEERLHFALSEDGMHFTALNNDKPILRQTVGTGCLRDPFIIRGEDGYFYILATDMRSEDGWGSNRNFVSWRSRDLVNWTDESLFEVAGKYSTTLHSDKAWAPEALYDEKRGEYFVYFSSLHPDGVTQQTVLVYAYTKDFRSFTTEPQLLYAPRERDAIDGDMIFVNGQYYLFFKHQQQQRIMMLTAPSMTGPFEGDGIPVSPSRYDVEGSAIYKIGGTDKWILIADAYGQHRYIMASTHDLRRFRRVPRRRFRWNFRPRHGFVLGITQAEYDRLSGHMW